MRQETVLDLVELIYAAAYDPAEWPRFLDALSSAVGGTGASLAHARLDGCGTNIQAGVGVFGPDFQREYQPVASSDPWLIRAHLRGLWKKGTIGIGEDLIPFRELERTSFYHDFGRRHDYVGGMSGVIEANDSELAAVSLSRRKNGAFGQAEVALMRELMPHLRRALQVHRRLVAAETREQGLRHALDKIATGAILVTRDGAVLFINDSARETDCITRRPRHGPRRRLRRSCLRHGTPQSAHQRHRRRQQRLGAAVRGSAVARPPVEPATPAGRGRATEHC